MKILITRKIPGNPENVFSKAGHSVDINENDRPYTREELLDKLSKNKYDAVLSLLTDKIDKEVFDVTPSTKIFANYAVGYDNVDIEEAKKRGVVITNTPTPLVSEAVAEHTLALIFSLMMKIAEGDAFVRKGLYTAWDPNLFIHPDLQGKTIGIVGAGRIGSTVGRVLHHGLGCNILYYDIKRNDYIEQDCNASFLANLNELLAKSDVVTLHVPLLPTTRHLINSETLSKMKAGSYLINTARGGVVDEEALAQALVSKHIAGAALDVFEHEPQPFSGLLSLSNVVFTPHTASATTQVREEMTRIATENIINILSGKIAVSPVM